MLDCYCGLTRVSARIRVGYVPNRADWYHKFRNPRITHTVSGISISETALPNSLCGFVMR